MSVRLYVAVFSFLLDTYGLFGNAHTRTEGTYMHEIDQETIYIYTYLGSWLTTLALPGL